MKLKLKTKRNNKPIIIIAIVAAVLLLAIGITVAIVLGNKAKEEAAAEEAYKQEIVGISINYYPDKRIYLVGEEFDPTGIRIEVRTNGEEYKSFVSDLSQLTFTGFDSSVTNDNLVITVMYEGWTATFDVVVKEEAKPDPTLESIEVKDLPLTYDLEYWNEYGPYYFDAYLLLTYSDGSTKTEWIKNEWATQREILTAPGKTTVTINYKGNSITVEFTITN